ncbi:MAG: polysaccharide deacetylase [Elusimicrobia bacterium CG_4_10_14_0_2_um_filter_56_8]|nr:MAG: hypothetical protein AUJ51_07975 [Elusimicrobia bacterium CG1_02_56_21]PJA18016.1 MAG: polysaccharide deacetylase [Elusimicrobia bacterium CG_4_10_14_0_2_um_filter_56_8]
MRITVPKLKITAAAALCLLASYSAALPVKEKSDVFKSYYTEEYLAFKKRIMGEFKKAGPGRFSEFVKNARVPRDKAGDENHKVMAFTFDACGGRSDGYNMKLIEYLRREQIPATLFVTGVWIEKNKEVFAELAADPLFEIENHGLRHRLCSTEGKTVYGVRATRDLGGVIDEMELGARYIYELTGRRPIFFRSATAYTDELSLRVAGRIGMEVVSYDILAGDANRFSAKKMSRNILKGARHGAVVIMHFNHPEWPNREALELAVPELRRRGYNFIKLDGFSLR